MLKLLNPLFRLVLGEKKVAMMASIPSNICITFHSINNVVRIVQMWKESFLEVVKIHYRSFIVLVGWRCSFL